VSVVVVATITPKPEQVVAVRDALLAAPLDVRRLAHVPAGEAAKGAL
jgi:hypothetical protein